LLSSDFILKKINFKNLYKIISLSDGDDYDYDAASDDDDKQKEEEEEIEEDEEEDPDISDTIQNVNPELSKKYNLDYIKFKHKLYSEFFYINALQ